MVQSRRHTMSANLDQRSVFMIVPALSSAILILSKSPRPPNSRGLPTEPRLPAAPTPPPRRRSRQGESKPVLVFCGGHARVSKYFWRRVMSLGPFSSSGGYNSSPRACPGRSLMPVEVVWRPAGYTFGPRHRFEDRAAPGAPSPSPASSERTRSSEIRFSARRVPLPRA